MSASFELNKDQLVPVLEKVLGARTFEILNFSINTLKPGLGNVTSLGVYRVTVQVAIDSKTQTVSVVVKHLADGRPIMDASEETNWNYYRREIDFFESPLSALIPKSIGYPQYLGHTKLQDGTELFWNSDLGDLEKNIWTWSDCLHATELLAELNSVDYSKTDGYQWLNRSSMEGWLEFFPAFFEPLYPRFIQIISNDSKLAFAFESFGKFMLAQHKFKDELRSLRQCFVHGDFNLNNLVMVSGGNTRLTALDWQQCGVNAIGSEVASIFNTASELKVIKPDPDKFNEICAIYMKRFNELNKENPVLLKDIRYAVALMGYFILLGVGVFFNQPDPAKSDAENDEKLKSLLIEFAEGPLALYAEVLHEFL